MGLGFESQPDHEKRFNFNKLSLLIFINTTFSHLIMSGTYLFIRHFGPLTSVEIWFNRFTVFVGPQGSGKSSIAKLYSTFLWMEKRLVRGLDTIAYFEQYSRFKKKLAAYHRIESYFYDDTEILFKGRNYMFDFRNGKLSISPTDSDMEVGEVAKVMYVPSERNYLSTMGNVSGLKSLPESLYTFKEEFDSACRHYYAGLNLPIENVRYEYDRLNNISWLIGKDYKVRLTDASSGFQAVTPLLLVTSYLSDLVGRRKAEKSGTLSVEELQRLRMEVNKVINNPGLSDEVREAALAGISKRYRYSGFVNIVEEPEENLFPSSQKSVLYSLISYVLKGSGNELVFTTHSPYMINFLTLSIKGGEIKRKGGDEQTIGGIVPVESLINGKEVSVYQLSNGCAEKLSTYNDLPSDNNYLNNSLFETNEAFNELLDIEDAITVK